MNQMDQRAICLMAGLALRALEMGTGWTPDVGEPPLLSAYIVTRDPRGHRSASSATPLS